MKISSPSDDIFPTTELNHALSDDPHHLRRQEPAMPEREDGEAAAPLREPVFKVARVRAGRVGQGAGVDAEVGSTGIVPRRHLQGVEVPSDEIHARVLGLVMCAVYAALPAVLHDRVAVLARVQVEAHRVLPGGEVVLQGEAWYALVLRRVAGEVGG